MAELEALKSQAEAQKQNENLVEKLYVAWGSGDSEAISALLDPDFGFFSPSMVAEPLSLEEALELNQTVFKGFPDAEWDVVETIAAGDKIVCRCIFTGTHEGEYQGMQPTGAKVRVSIISIFGVVNGKVVEYREEFDQFGLMAQLGMELKPKVREVPNITDPSLPTKKK